MVIHIQLDSKKKGHHIISNINDKYVYLVKIKIIFVEYRIVFKSVGITKSWIKIRKIRYISHTKNNILCTLCI